MADSVPLLYLKIIRHLWSLMLLLKNLLSITVSATGYIFFKMINLLIQEGVIHFVSICSNIFIIIGLMQQKKFLAFSLLHHFLLAYYNVQSNTLSSQNK
jgi:hypothetical protein